MNLKLYWYIDIQPNDENYERIRLNINLEEINNLPISFEKPVHLTNNDAIKYISDVLKCNCPEFNNNELIIFHFIETNIENYLIRIRYVEIVNTELLTPSFINENTVISDLIKRDILFRNNLHNIVSKKYYLEQFLCEISKPRFYDLTPIIPCNTAYYQYQIDNINWALKVEKEGISGVFHDKKAIEFPDGRIYDYDNSCFIDKFNEVTIYGGFIADDPGVGKTLQLLSLCMSTPEIKTLILVPNHLYEHWQMELLKHFNGGHSNMEISLIERVNYDGFDRIIIDEIHEIYEKPIFNTICSQNFKYKWALSATPFGVNNSLHYLIRYFIHNNIYNIQTKDYLYNKELLEKLFRKNTLETIKTEVKFPEMNIQNILLKMSSKEQTLYTSGIMTENKDKNNIRKLCCDLSLDIFENKFKEMTIEEFNTHVLQNKLNILNKNISEGKEIEDKLNKLTTTIIINEQIEKNIQHYKRLLFEKMNEIALHKKAYNYLKQQFEEENTCYICCDNFEESYVFLPCFHKFHEECLNTWFKLNNKVCPMCRQETHQNDCMIIDKNKKVVHFSSKLNYLINLLKLNEERYIIFTQFPEMIDKMKYVLERENITCVKFEGSSSVNEFKTNGKIMILSSTCNASGLDLTFIKNVIIFEPFNANFEYLKDIERQIIGRVFRINQKFNVNIYRLILKETIEEEIYNTMI